MFWFYLIFACFALVSRCCFSVVRILLFDGLVFNSVDLVICGCGLDDDFGV